MRWRAGKLALLAFPAVILAGFAALIVQDHRAVARRAGEEEALQSALRAERRQVFARGWLDPVLELCRAGWRDELSFHHEPSALAWTRRSLDGYFLEGDDQIWLITLYGKEEMADLSPAEKRLLKATIDTELTQRGARRARRRK